jgi:hypothetical protein
MQCANGDCLQVSIHGKGVPGLPRCFNIEFFISRKSTKREKTTAPRAFFFLARPISKKNQQKHSHRAQSGHFWFW